MLFLQVKRALSLWADRRVTISAVRTAYKSTKGKAKASISYQPVVNENTGIQSVAYSAFSQQHYRDDTARLMASAIALTEEEFDTIIDKAQAFVKISNRGKGDSEMATSKNPVNILKPLEVSDDEAEGQWVPKLCKSHIRFIVNQNFIVFAAISAQPVRDPHSSANKEPSRTVQPPPPSSYNQSAKSPSRGYGMSAIHNGSVQSHVPTSGRNGPPHYHEPHSHYDGPVPHHVQPPSGYHDDTQPNPQQSRRYYQKVYYYEDNPGEAFI
jgi:hypothetical protein